MQYALIAAILFVALLVYFKIADRYNIIDKPNHRSAHSEITLRGGGVIYPIAFILLAITMFADPAGFLGRFEHIHFLLFGAGLLLISVLSFVDDLVDLPSRVRVIFQFLAVSLLLYSVGVFSLLPVWAVVLVYILAIGILNAYNFMDGINGMSGLYSFVLLGTLWYVNAYLISFADPDFIVYPLLASFVFLFFNFRKKAKCFMGDVGSMSVAFWILALLSMLIIESGSYKWFLLLGVYGVETILTLIERIYRRENIFEAHRRHLYQLFVNEKAQDHRLISFVYAALQVVMNAVVISFNGADSLIFMIVLSPVILVYLLSKTLILKKTGAKVMQ